MSKIKIQFMDSASPKKKVEIVLISIDEAIKNKWRNLL